MSNWFDPGSGNFMMVDGQVVEKDALYITEKLMDYDPDLRVLCLDPEQSSVNEAPFIVVKIQDNGSMTRVLEAWTLDDQIIHRVWLADQTKNDQWEQLIKKEAELKAKQEDADNQIMGHNHEIFQGALATDKSEYSFEKNDELVTISDNHGIKYNKGKKSYSV